MSLIPTDFSRRDFLATSARLALVSAVAAGPTRRLFAAGKVKAEESWGRVEEISSGLWAVISTPLPKRDFKTLCNGGIVAGKQRVLVVESFAGPEGAAWVAEQAKELGGRWPTDVVISHYHGDHANGLAGFVRDGEQRPRIWSTQTTVELIQKGGGGDSTRQEMLADATLLDEGATELDLGGQKVNFHTRSGHTPSDVTVELDDPSVVFFGDLLWNGLFPNYRDAMPSVLAQSVRVALRKRPTVYVPGHGPLPNQDTVGLYLDVIDSVEAAAKKAFEAGTSAADAAKAYRLPEAAAGWHLFRETYFETAINAWHKELGKDA